MSRRWVRSPWWVRWLRFLAWVVLIGIFAFAWERISEPTEWSFVLDAPRAAADILGRMFPPDVGVLQTLARPLWDTLNIATLGTLLALFMGVPVALLAARNTTPSALLVRPVALLVVVTSRSVNSLVWAMLLVAVVGPGILAGVFAIALRSVGFVAKLTYEAIEEIDPKPVEAIQATGASAGQVWTYAMVPQVAPAFAGLSIFRWDVNIRESTVLGFVGAGGIGLQLNAAIQALEWAQVCTILLVIFATVLISELVSARVRAAIE